MTRGQRQLHDAKVAAKAELAKRQAQDNLTPQQVEQEKAKIEFQAENAELAAKDMKLAARAREQKLEKLPWIVRALVLQIMAWSDFGASMGDGKNAEKPSLYGSLIKDAYSNKR